MEQISKKKFKEFKVGHKISAQAHHAEVHLKVLVLLFSHISSGMCGIEFRESNSTGSLDAFYLAHSTMVGGGEGSNVSI